MAEVPDIAEVPDFVGFDRKFRQKIKNLTKAITKDAFSALEMIERCSRDMLVETVISAVTDEPPHVLKKLLDRIKPRFDDLVSPDYSPFALAYIKEMHETCRILSFQFAEFRERTHDGILPTLLESQEYHDDTERTCGRMFARYPHLIPDVFMHLTTWNLRHAMLVWRRHAMTPESISDELIESSLDLIDGINEDEENLEAIKFLLEVNILQEKHISGIVFVLMNIDIFKAINKKLRLSNDFLNSVAQNSSADPKVRSYARGQFLLRESTKGC